MIWKTVGAVGPKDLGDARLALHWAAQLVSAPGTSLLSPEGDYAHTNLGWNHELGLLTGRKCGPEGLQSALMFEGLELAVLDGALECASMRLTGQSLQGALGWLGRELGAEASALALPAHEMPSHPVGDGSVFSEAGSSARAELAAWFANAFEVVRALVRDDPAASAVRCWPHHFDVASLVTLDSGLGAEEARSIGIGFSPGDGSYAQPYFYVTPWPYPDTGKLPPLPEGVRWHVAGWTAAVLTAEQLLRVPRAEQERSVSRALAGALSACRELFST